MFSLKSVVTCLGCIAALALGSSCKHEKTYADYLEDEKRAIKNYISSNNIKVVTTMPDSTTEWIDADGSPVYYRFSDGLLFHLIDKGDTTTLEPNINNMAWVRHIGVTLSGVTLFDCSAARNPNPDCFRIISSPNYDRTLWADVYGVGFQKAVRNMYAGGHCKVIIPFKIGNGYAVDLYGIQSSDGDAKRPMAYEIWLTRVE
ncbi:MAG: DUF4827 domain-containing protein [Paludibacteraceae bacterium]|nr:DUF4827 domain-containing protein [Paludibacteraceae bacterium]